MAMQELHAEPQDRNILTTLFAPASRQEEESTSPPRTTTLNPSDLFHSSTYLNELKLHLEAVFPHVPTSAIRGAVAGSGGDYPAARAAVEAWSPSRLATFLDGVGSWFGKKSRKATTAETSVGTRVTDPDLAHDIALSEVLARARIALALSREDERLARQLNNDWTPTDQRWECECCYDDQVVFEDLSTCSGSGDEVHVFCRTCVKRQCEEHAFGGAPLSLDVESAGGGSGGVRCLAADCVASFTDVELRRVLDDKTHAALERRRADVAIERLLAAQQTGCHGERAQLVRCPFCPFVAEVVDAPELRRTLWRSAFPILFLFVNDLTRSGSSSFSRLASDATHFILSLVLLSTAYVIALIAIVLLPLMSILVPSSSTAPALDLGIDLGPHLELLSTPHIAFIAAYDLIAQLVQARAQARPGTARQGQPTRILRCCNTPSGRPLPAVFGDGLCRNVHEHEHEDGDEDVVESRAELVARVWPTLSPQAPVVNRGCEAEEQVVFCGRVSCLTCARPLTPQEGAAGELHTCYARERDGLRLAVERARTRAVERVCAGCGVGFVKAGGGGCNKVSFLS